MQPRRLLVLRSVVTRKGSLFWGVLGGRGGQCFLNGTLISPTIS